MFMKIIDVPHGTVWVETQEIPRATQTRQCRPDNIDQTGYRKKVFNKFPRQKVPDKIDQTGQ